MSPWGKFVRWLSRRSPAEHYAALDKRLTQLGELEQAAESELDRLRARNGQTRAIRKATKRLARLRRRTNRLRRVVAAAKPFVGR